MENLIVQKYGGTSVANAERIMHVAKTVSDTYKKGKRVVVVVSAQGHTTDRLVEKARGISSDSNRRELDMLLVTGEQQSAALMAMALQSLGHDAVSLNAAQVGIEATSVHGNAQIKRIRTARLTEELEKGRIVVVAGFQGINRFGDMTTLGRGASDTTAVALAAVLEAELCEIYTDVDGIYTVDPRIVPTAKKLDVISYDDMLELASSGAGVLHNRAVEMAKRYRVNLVLRSSMSEIPGTLIKEATEVERLAVSGIAIDRNVARISVTGLEDKPGVAYSIFDPLAKGKLNVDVILLSVGEGEKRDYCFTVHKQEMGLACEILEQNKEKIGYDTLITDENLAKLTIVGAGMANNAGVASTMFEALYECGVNIETICTSEIKITVLIDQRHITKAAKAVHDKFEPMFSKDYTQTEDA
ncbi:MAG: aspartate kinase [Defluviitaleaceae bacterium]|nr:aspartate kinase [Defluviitaleaceae bacterium]MCL2262441.1 aspartate kinase [Defluviitaleaceae bacterium]